MKRAVGGPKRWEGLPYRGPSSELVTVSPGLFTTSDGALICARVEADLIRSGLDENMTIRKSEIGRVVTFHKPEVPIFVTERVHTLKD